MIQTKRSVFFLILILALSGCAISVNIPINRFDSPETTGKLGRVEVAGSGGAEDEITLTSDYTVTPPNTTNPYLVVGTFARVLGGVGLLESLDVEVRNFDELWAKWQIIGDPRLTAQAGNFALAVTGGAGYGQTTSTNSSLFNPNVTGSLSETQDWVDGAIVLGYRFAPIFLVYGGPFARATYYNGNWSLTPVSGSSAQPSSGTYSGSVTTTGGNLGVELGTALFQARIEAAYANESAGVLNTGRWHIGAELAFEFGAH